MIYGNYQEFMCQIVTKYCNVSTQLKLLYCHSVPNITQNISNIKTCVNLDLNFAPANYCYCYTQRPQLKENGIRQVTATD